MRVSWLLLLLLVVVEKILGAFPRVMWAYVPELQEMTVLQHLCVDNLKRYAQQSSLSFRFITNLNYTIQFEDWHEVTTIAQMSHLDQKATLAALIQLKVLQQYGGIWVDSTTMLTGSLDWLYSLQESQFVNNAVENSEVVMFYKPGWFDRTDKKDAVTQEKVIVSPNYYSWFMAASKQSIFIKDLSTLLTETLILSYENSQANLKARGVELGDYLQDPTEFLSLLVRTTVNLKQKQLDRQQSSGQKLAVSHYHISGIDSSKTAFVVDQHAQGYVDLTTKYLAQLTYHQLSVDPTYLIRIRPEVARELLQTLESNYVDLDHFHAGAKLLCDNAEVPLRYVVKDSIIDRYLLKGNNWQQIEVFEEEYIRHHCQGSFIEAYLQFGKLFLIIAAMVGHVYVTRKAILFFKPEWGKRHREVQFEEARGQSD